MDTNTKTVIGNTLYPQSVVKKIHKTIIAADAGENADYDQWLENTIDTADVTVEISGYTTDGVVDYQGYYRAVYNQVKQFIQNKLNYSVDQWKVTDQAIIS